MGNQAPYGWRQNTHWDLIIVFGFIFLMYHHILDRELGKKLALHNTKRAKMPFPSPWCHVPFPTCQNNPVSLSQIFISLWPSLHCELPSRQALCSAGLPTLVPAALLKPAARSAGARFHYSLEQAATVCLKTTKFSSTLTQYIIGDHL